MILLLDEQVWNRQSMGFAVILCSTLGVWRIHKFFLVPRASSILDRKTHPLFPVRC